MAALSAAIEAQIVLENQFITIMTTEFTTIQAKLDACIRDLQAAQAEKAEAVRQHQATSAEMAAQHEQALQDLVAQKSKESEAAMAQAREAALAAQASSQERSAQDLQALSAKHDAIVDALSKKLAELTRQMGDATAKLQQAPLTQAGMNEVVANVIKGPYPRAAVESPEMQPPPLQQQPQQPPSQQQEQQPVKQPQRGFLVPRVTRPNGGVLPVTRVKLPSDGGGTRRRRSRKRRTRRK